MITIKFVMLFSLKNENKLTITEEMKMWCLYDIGFTTIFHMIVVSLESDLTKGGLL